MTSPAAEAADPAAADRAAPRRADAVRNRARVVAAAAQVLAERGLEADVDEIAERAGVGKGTIYRSFPTKEDLLVAIAAERLAWMLDRWNEAQSREDAWAALRSVLMVIAERQASDLGLVVCTASTMAEHPALRETREACDAAILVLMQRAQRAGEMRRGVRPDDLRVLFGGVSRVLAERRCDDPAAWRRGAALALDALRAEGPPGPLPRAAVPGAAG